MDISPKTPTLRLKDYEAKTSRLILKKVPVEEANAISSSGTIKLGREPADRHLWEHTLKDDLVMIVAFEGDYITRYAYRVLGKAISPPKLSSVPDDKPYTILLESLGVGYLKTLKGEAFFYSDPSPYAPRPIFKELWEECHLTTASPYNHPQQLLSPKDAKYSIHIAASREDYDFVSRIAVFHPFGARKAFLTLIATTGNIPVGAILIQPSVDSNVSHKAAWRIFREDYTWIQKQAITIVRIYSSPTAKSKWAVHKALMEAAIFIAPALVAEPLSVIEGVSYDYHPVTIPLGFQVEVPKKLERAFYYWKPVNLPSKIRVVTNIAETMREIHELLERRRAVHYWLAPGPHAGIEVGIRRSAWALHKHDINVGRWRMLSPGHIVFLMSPEKRIKAYGIVAGTEKRIVQGLEKFPLWIDFRKDMALDLDLDISEQMKATWFSEIKYSGLVPLPEEFGAELKGLADQQKAEGRMWVDPNPYLLHQTEFEVIPNQVFVVQSWTLRETIFPEIKKLLTGSGYTVKYAGDRDGQVVFEDIWLMLNESEVIVVDFTEKRPNVYLEYGMALVLGKPIIAITQDKDHIPSDTPNLKYIIYLNQLGDESLRKLPKAIQDTISDIQRIKSKKGRGG